MSPDRTSPHSIGRRVAFPTPSPTAPPVFLGIGAVDEAWKTRNRWRFCRGGRQPDRRGDRGREHRPIQSGAELRFPPLRPPRLGGLGTGAVDEAWKTHDRRALVRGAQRGPADKHRPFHSLPNPRRRSPDSQVAVVKGWITPSTPLADAWRTGGCCLMEHRPIQSGAELRFPPLRPPRLRFFWGSAPWTKRGKTRRLCALFWVGGGIRSRRQRGRNIARFKLVWLWVDVGRSGAPCGRNIAPINPEPSCVSHPSTTAPRLISGTGAVDEAWKTHERRCPGSGRAASGSRRGPAGGTSPYSFAAECSPKCTILLTCTVFGRKLSLIEQYHR